MAAGPLTHNGDVIFANHTFNINSVMNTTNLVNCDVIFRGENVARSEEGGWHNGNGQAWYTKQGPEQPARSAY
jgi:hypothetical protein